MHIQHLSLTSFRNYLRVEFDIAQGISLFQGANAQGKTNLLESICYLATTRCSRNVPEKELINWSAMEESLPFARVSADVLRGDRKLTLEIVIRPRFLARDENGMIRAPMQRLIRVNGIARRATGIVGQLNMVMFSPRDIDLVGGEPMLRRRYLDITNAQVNPRYLKTLQRYNRVLAQRNHLLRQIAMRHAGIDELAFWDQELVAAGSYIVLQRQQTITKLEEQAVPIHWKLSGEHEKLTLHYRPSINVEASALINLGDIEHNYSMSLRAAREKELARGLSLIGPHRDDVEFLVNGVNMGPFGSRGQQRTVALSVKLAEAEFMLSETGETPVLLLDDVLSELDVERRQNLLAAVVNYQQVLMTTTDFDRFPSDFLARAHRFTVETGRILFSGSI